MLGRTAVRGPDGLIGDPPVAMLATMIGGTVPAGARTKNGPAGPTAAARAWTAAVRAVHASPGAPPVDDFVDGERTLAGLGIGVATDGVDLPASVASPQVVPSGEEPTVAVSEARPRSPSRCGL